MSELISAQRKERNCRWNLRASVSTMALLAAVSVSWPSQASDTPTDRPTVWIDLGGQFEQINTGQDIVAPPFVSQEPASGPLRPGVEPISPSDVQKPLDYSYGGEGKITFAPGGSNWIFSAAIRYGRSTGSKHIHRSTTPLPYTLGSFHLLRTNAEFADAASKRSESHSILDFQVGKDVGLGLFGQNAQSTLSLGVRFAQFHNSLQASLGMDNNNGGYKYFGNVKLPANNPHTFLAQLGSTRSFRGAGPSASWNGSVPFAGSPDHMQFDFNWGINAAVLFGRQKASVHHQTTAHSHPTQVSGHYLSSLITVYQHLPPARMRSRSVTVPNIGGMAGISLRFPNAKVSMGYRADFFLGAMDGGIDARKSEDIGFHGPFATISIGLGG